MPSPRRRLTISTLSAATGSPPRHALVRSHGEISALPGIRIIGPRVGAERSGLVSFAFDGVHAHDVVTFADEDGVALRGGHHCNSR